MQANTNYIAFHVGYMDKGLFVQWFKEILLKNGGRQRPVLLLMDNHVSHVGAEVIDLAKANQVRTSSMHDAFHQLRFGYNSKSLDKNYCINVSLSKMPSILNNLCMGVTVHTKNNLFLQLNNLHIKIPLQSM